MSSFDGGYYGRFLSDGELIAAGKFIGGAMSLYGRDGKFHYKPEYDKWYYEGDFDEISDEEFEKFKKEMDQLGKHIKYAYYRDGTVPDYVVREVIDGDNMTAEAWDYKNECWVPDVNAWETIDDQRGNWGLEEDYVEDYIKKMLDRFPYIKDRSIKPKPDGATRKKEKSNVVETDRPMAAVEFENIENILRNLVHEEVDSFIVVDFNNYVNDDKVLFMQAKKWGDGYHVEIGFDMEDSDWDHPLILGADDVSLEETLDLFRRVGLKAEETGDIDLILNNFRDIGFGRKGKETGAVMSSFDGGYYGRFSYDGKLVMAGKFIGGALSLYDGRDGQFHYDPRYDKMYYEGEFDEISDEEFEKFKKKMDELAKQE